MTDRERIYKHYIHNHMPPSSITRTVLWTLDARWKEFERLVKGDQASPLTEREINIESWRQVLKKAKD